ERSESDLSDFSRHGRSTVWASRFREAANKVRSVGEGNRRRARPPAPLGKYYSAVAYTDANANANSHANAISIASGFAGSVAECHVCVSAPNSFAVIVIMNEMPSRKRSLGRVCPKMFAAIFLAATL